MNDDDGIIISPGWPNAYDSNQVSIFVRLILIKANFVCSYQECFWQIHIGSTGKIFLNFTHMDIEDQTHCLYDYVEVRL